MPNYEVSEILKVNNSMSESKPNNVKNEEPENKPDSVVEPKKDVPETKSNRAANAELPKATKENKKKQKQLDDQPSQIFLIEIVLDTLELSYCTEFMNRCYKGPNFITFQYLQQDPFTICENAPVMRECYETKTGSSSLFGLTMTEIEAARHEFIVGIKLYRNTPDDNILLGSGTLTLTNLMKCICAMCDANEFRKSIEKEEMKRKRLCMPKQVKEVFSENLHQCVALTSPSESICDTAATLGVFVRLTCFGKLMQINCQMKCETENTNDDDNFPNYVNCPNRCTPSRRC